jgi:hypothetical protein
MRAFVLLALVSRAACAQEAPGDFAYRAPLETARPASHYRFALPAAAYEGAARRDLGDVRVFNAAGETVPHAFVPREAQKPEPQLQGAPLFPLYGDPARSLDATLVTVERKAAGTVVSVKVGNATPARRRALIGYLLDASAIRQPLDALVLDWNAVEPFTGQARVEASDDLRAWSTLAAGSPLLHLEHAGAMLERRRVELGGARARYLRVSFSGVPSAFALRQARLELKPLQAELQREWRPLAGSEGKTRGEWSYDSGGHFPVDRVRLRLPQPNTVVQVHVLSRERLDDPWRPAGAAVAYRLSRDGEEIASPELPVRSAAERYWQVRVEQKGGGIGAGSLVLEIGWVPHEVVFAARGAGPFALGYGNREAKGGLLPIGAVLPRGRDGAQAAVAEPATVGESATQAPAGASLLRRFFDNRDAKKWMLWAVLVAGVGVLAWMAFRLLQQMGGGAGKP